MSVPILYIGPGLGLGTIALILLIAGMVLFSFGYILRVRLKQRFRKKD